MSKSRRWAKRNERRPQSFISFDAIDGMTCIGVIFNNLSLTTHAKCFLKYSDYRYRSKTDFTPESKRLIEAKIKEQNNGTNGIKKGEYGLSLKDENEMTLADFFILF